MANEKDDVEWYEPDADVSEEDYPIDQYEITASPNDFNISTIHSFIESGSVSIPGFQRNYVWDIRRASKLIESLIIGLPVPQIFLYEESRNKFLVIDGQQRLMSIYYFIKQRFPRKEARGQLRRIFEEHGKIPESVLQDDSYFTKFNLRLPARTPDQPNRFDGLNYSTLGDYQTAFSLRTIRNVIIKQTSPKDDDSAVYEIFNRLNTGGVNLAPQEIRMSLYHSEFYMMLLRANVREGWRRIVGVPEPDLHMKDVEFLLRAFAVLVKGGSYKPSMVRFLNSFSRNAKAFRESDVSYLESLFDSFLSAAQHLSSDVFQTKTGRFSITVLEAVFAAVCGLAYANRTLVTGKIDENSVSDLKKDAVFAKSSEQRTTDATNVERRLGRAKELIKLV